MNEQTPSNAGARNDAPLSEKKKTALLRYMAILFGVAFLLVLLTLLLETSKSRETISDLSQSQAGALQNALVLQEENQSLTETRLELEERLEDAEESLAAAEKAAEAAGEEAETAASRAEALESQLETANAETAALESELETAGETLEQARQAYDLLLLAADAAAAGDREALDAALSQLEPLAGHLSEEALTRYENLRGGPAAES